MRDQPNGERGKKAEPIGPAKEPWQILFVLLAAMVSGTGANFLYGFAMLGLANDWALSHTGASALRFLPMLVNPAGGIFLGWLSNLVDRILPTQGLEGKADPAASIGGI